MKVSVVQSQNGIMMNAGEKKKIVVLLKMIIYRILVCVIVDVIGHVKLMNI